MKSSLESYEENEDESNNNCQLDSNKKKQKYFFDILPYKV